MRKPRGRNPFTTTALRRAVHVARETGVDRVEVELPGQSRIILSGIVSKRGGKDDDKPEDIIELLK
jgi:hypothetical protein